MPIPCCKKDKTVKDDKNNMTHLILMRLENAMGLLQFYRISKIIHLADQIQKQPEITAGHLKIFLVSI